MSDHSPCARAARCRQLWAAVCWFYHLRVSTVRVLCRGVDVMIRCPFPPSWTSTRRSQQRSSPACCLYQHGVLWWWVWDLTFRTGLRILWTGLHRCTLPSAKRRWACLVLCASHPATLCTCSPGSCSCDTLAAQCRYSGSHNACAAPWNFFLLPYT